MISVIKLKIWKCFN